MTISKNQLLAVFAQKLFDKIDGGKCDDVIFARGSLGGGIKGGAGSDVLMMRPKRTAAPRSRLQMPTDRC